MEIIAVGKQLLPLRLRMKGEDIEIAKKRKKFKRKTL